MMSIRNFLASVLLAISVSGVVYAQPSVFPSKPIRLISPYPAGGAVDIIARTLGPKLTSSMGQPIIVENRSGASGIVASENLFKSPADGYSVIIVISSHAVNPSMYKRLPYDTLNDFSPVTQLGAVPNILSVHPSLPVQNVKQLIALSRSRKGEMNYASFGNGSSSHLSGELFNIMANVKMTAVTYKGAAPAVIDVLGGHIPIMFGNIPVSLPHVKSGKIRAVAVTSNNRSPTLPDLPTVAESGLPGYDIGEWFGVLVHGKTPKELVSKWNQEMVKALGDQEVQARLKQLGVNLIGSSPSEFEAYIRAQMKKWGEVIEKAGIEQG